MKLPTASGGVSSGIAPSCLVVAFSEDGSQHAFALTSFGAVHFAFHPCGPAKPDGICDKPQGILAKANKPGGKMIKAIEHISFTVSSLEDSLGFFCNRLGLEATAIKEVDHPDVKQIVGMPDARLRISLMKLPTDRNIELIQYIQPEGRLASVWEERITKQPSCWALCRTP
jgi:hypothetical protein